MDKKWALMLRMVLLAFGDFKMADDTALAYVPDARSVPELFDSGGPIIMDRFIQKDFFMEHYWFKEIINL